MMTGLNVSVFSVDNEKSYLYKDVDVCNIDRIIKHHMIDFIVIWSKDYTNRIVIENSTMQLKKGL